MDMNKIGVVVFAHGSKENSVRQTTGKVTAKLQRLLGDTYLVIQAFLQYDDTSLLKAVESLSQMGIRKIVVQPYFLFCGVHIKKDLMNEIMVIKEKYPHIELTLGKSLGDDERMAEILADRVFEI